MGRASKCNLLLDSSRVVNHHLKPLLEAGIHALPAAMRFEKEGRFGERYSLAYSPDL
jgi:DNA-binding transcriptional ArsR family regulator